MRDTIIKLFQKQAQENPDKIAVTTSVDMSFVCDALESEKFSEDAVENILGCCFARNPYLFERRLDSENREEEARDGHDAEVWLLKTHRHNNVLVNRNVIELLKIFDPKRSMECVYKALSPMRLKFTLFAVNPDDLYEISFRPSQSSVSIFSNGSPEEFASLIRFLYKNHTIYPSDYSTGSEDYLKLETRDFDTDEAYAGKMNIEGILGPGKEIQQADVLFLGGTPGVAAVGLLYMASYLMRNGIKACCQFNDSDGDQDSLHRNVIQWMEKIRPRIVCVSLKWFPHIARVLAICSIVKQYANDVKVVVGGDTASYFWKEIIDSEYVDYVIRGDGELPLLCICMEKEFLPNCAYKRDGELVVNPISYIQGASDASDVFLSHMDEILLSRNMLLLGTFFIHTHKGCMMNCIYCGACHEAQKRIYNRTFFFRRGIEQVRKDIITAKKYTSTFMFDFDASNDELLKYCRDIWEGIDLGEYFCIFTNLIPPSEALLQYVNSTFKYVYWNLDICSLSERHRKQMSALKLVKPQPSDREMLSFFDLCEKHRNAEVRVNMIAGLPYFNVQDMRASKKMISYLLHTYASFSELHWARLHAQPGASAALEAEKYDMTSLASTYEDFLKYSSMNFENKPYYPSMESFHYPYIYYKDEALNSEISRHYSEINLMIERYQKNRPKFLATYKSLTYGELNETSNVAAQVLRQAGGSAGKTVALLADNPLELITGILGIMKSGAVCLYINKELSADKIRYILEDNRADILLLQNNRSEKFYNTIRIPGLKVIKMDQEEMPENPETGTDETDLTNDCICMTYTLDNGGEFRTSVTGADEMISSFNVNEDEKSCHTTENVVFHLMPKSSEEFYKSLISCLLSGKCLVIPDGRGITNYNYLKAMVRDKRTTALYTIPSMYKELLRNSEPGELKPLRFALLHGGKKDQEMLKLSEWINPDITLIEEA